MEINFKLSELIKSLSQYGQNGFNVFIMVKNLNNNSFKLINTELSELCKDIEVSDYKIFLCKSRNDSYCYYVFAFTEDDLNW